MSLGVALMIEPRAAAAPEAFRAVCTLTNTGESAEEINLAALSSPSLALEMRTATGEPVYFPPPPVPGPEPPLERLAPGVQKVVEFGGFLPGWTEPGDYEARCRYLSGQTSAYSDWVAFTLTR